jgi:Uma2 family endonuclease
MAITPKLMTADELLLHPDDGLRHELVQRGLQSMAPPVFEHGDLAMTIGGELRAYVRAHRLGRVTSEVGFRLADDPDTVRAPDVAFIRNDRLPTGDAARGYFRGAPDLAVEVISPNDRYTEVDEKVAEWLQHGCRLVLVVNPRRRTVAVHRADGSVSVLGIDGALDGEEVIPGWSLALSDLFDQE